MIPCRIVFIQFIFSVGCSSPTPKTDLGTIVVREFVASPTATAIGRYGEPVEPLGMELASRVADVLKRRGRDSVVVPHDAANDADSIVTGRTSRIDGGSRGTRVFASLLLGFGWTSWGIGGSTCAVEGETMRRDGSRVGSFHQELKPKGVGWFWIRFGESSSHHIRRCLTVLGANVANAVDSGRYVGGLTSGEPTSTISNRGTAALGRPAADRLCDLEQLYRDGLINEGEYRERRSKVLQES